MAWRIRKHGEGVVDPREFGSLEAAQEAARERDKTVFIGGEGLWVVYIETAQTRAAREALEEAEKTLEEARKSSSRDWETAHRNWRAVQHEYIRAF